MAEFQKFRTRPGTTDYGRDYELLITAYAALRLINDKSVNDFSITHNDEAYAYFDDLAVKVTYFDKRSHTFLFQIKHRSNMRPITPKYFFIERGPFSILRYCESFDFLGDKSNVTCIIFTNSYMNTKIVGQYIHIQGHDLVLKEDDDELFNTGTVFSLHNHDGWMDQFFQNFRIFANQMSIDEAKKTVNRILMELVQCQIFDTFINFIREVQLKNFVLKKEDVVLKLAEITLSPFMRTLSSKRYNSKCDPFAKIITKFDITTISEDLEDTVEAIWDLGEESREEHIVTHKYSLSGSTKFLTDEQRSKTLWYLNKVPLIMKIDDWNKTRVDYSLRLLHNNGVMRHFILLGPRRDYRGLDIFENLVDLDPELLAQFFVSIQERQEISLKVLLESIPELASVLTSSDLVRMTQETLHIGDQVAHLPQIYIPRRVTTPSGPVQETEMLQVFTNCANALLGEPGAGKSTLLSSLANKCPCDYWVVYLVLREYDTFFRKKPLFGEILPHFLQTGTQFETVFLRNGRIFLFLDGLDEIDNVDFVLDYIKYISERGIKVWFSSRLHLEATISNFLHISPIYLEELEKDEIRKYLPLESISTKITPLEISFLNELSSNGVTIDKDLIGPEIFTKFFEWKKKGGSLHQYEITALSTCLETETITKLNLDESANRRFLDEIRENGDKFGIISQVDEDRAIFTNHSYAEYLTSAWIIKNLSKVKILEEELFSRQNQNLKYMFDVMLASGNPLLLGVICQNVGTVREHINDSQEMEKRTPLHVLCSQRQVDDEIAEILLEKYDIFEKDQLFFWNCIDYAIRVDNLPVIDKMLMKYGDSPYFDNVYKKHNIAERAAELSCPHLLESCIKKKVTTKHLLHVAAKSTALVVDILIRNGFDINTKDEKRKTALEVALQEGNYEVTKLLIEKNANVNILTSRRRTLLHHAVAAKVPNLEIIELLIDKVDLEAIDFEGSTALHLACKEGRFDIVKKLVERGANVNAATYYKKTALHFAIPNVTIIEYLLMMGIDINYQDLNGVTALHLASKQKDIEVVKALLRHGADQNCVTNSGRSALHYAAASSDSVHIINLLIKEGVDVEGRDQGGVTPLHIAVEHGHLENVKCLLDNGANITTKDKNVRSCLHKSVCVKTPDPDLITLLIEKGIDIGAIDSSGMSALDLAKEKGQEDIAELLMEISQKNPVHDDITSKSAKEEASLHLEVATCYPNTEKIRLLLEHSVDAKYQNSEGESALHVACSYNNHYNVQALLDGGVDVDTVTVQKENALHFAMRLELPNIEVVKLLLKAKIDLNQKNVQGETPLHLACRHQHDDYVKELRDGGADIEVLDAKGRFAFDWAFLNESVEAMQLLLEAAVYRGAVHVVRTFLKKMEEKKILSVLTDLEKDDYPLYFAKHGDELQSDLLTKLTEVIKKYRDIHGDGFEQKYLIAFLKKCDWLKTMDVEVLQFDKLCPCRLHRVDK